MPTKAEIDSTGDALSSEAATLDRTEPTRSTAYNGKVAAAQRADRRASEGQGRRAYNSEAEACSRARTPTTRAASNRRYDDRDLPTCSARRNDAIRCSHPGPARSACRRSPTIRAEHFAPAFDDGDARAPRRDRRDRRRRRRADLRQHRRRARPRRPPARPRRRAVPQPHVERDLAGAAGGASARWRRCWPRTTAASTPTPALFARIDALHAERDALDLDAEQRARARALSTSTSCAPAPSSRRARAGALRRGDGAPRRADDALRPERARRRDRRSSWS